MKNIETKNNKEQQQVKPERFSYALYKVGDLIDENKMPCNEIKIAERTFRINNYNEGSMNTIDFIWAGRDIVEMIKRDLAYKTADYSRIYDGPDYEFGAFSDDQGNNKFSKEYIEAHPEECTVLSFLSFENGDLSKAEIQQLRADHINKPRHFSQTQSVAFDTQIKPFEEYFRFEIKDGDKVKYAEIFDASVYPSIVRDRVDLSNYDKQYDDDALQRLNINEYVMHELLKDRPNLHVEILRIIRAVCCPEKVDYKDVVYTTKEGGEVVKEHKKVLSGQYSSDDDYTTSIYCGGKQYEFPMRSPQALLNEAYSSMTHDPVSKATMKTLTKNYFTDNYILRSYYNNGKSSNR